MGGTLEGQFYVGAVTIGSLDPAEDEDLFDSLIAKVAICRSPDCIVLSMCKEQ
jgi:hypothetical protein